MSKLRTLGIMFSLAFMLLGGVFTPAPASAAAPERGIVIPIMPQEYLVQGATEGDVAAVVKMAREAGAKVTVNRSRAKGPGDIISPAAGVFHRVSPEGATKVVSNALADHNGSGGVQALYIEITFEIFGHTVTIIIED